MNWEERFKLYEKLYFNELDRRERISARLALPFAVLIATSGLLSFMLNSTHKPEVYPWAHVFWLLFVASAIALILGAWFFRKAWFGHTDKLLPTAGHIGEYHRKLVDTYAGYENRDELVEKTFKTFLFNYYAEYSSENAINNDQRSYNIYRATVGLTYSALLGLAATLPFFIGNQFYGNKHHDNSRAPTAASTAAAPER